MKNSDIEIKITERDLFDFVFSRESLQREKVDFLKNDNTYSEELNFYTELKISIDENIPSSVKRKLASKIKDYEFQNIVELYPVKDELPKKKNNVLILAASSADEKGKITTKTFLDDEKSVLIKYLNFGEYSKIYIFSTTNEELKNFKLKLLPQNLEFNVDNSSEPLRVNVDSDPDLISIKFN